MCPTKSSELPAAIAKKRLLLTDQLEQLNSVIVAYSGGVDSSLLAYYGRLVLRQNAKIVIALSPSLAQSELEAARLQAGQFDFDLIEIATEEVALGEYRRNDGMRCFFCKSTLFEHLQMIKDKLKISAIAYGANMDDLSDERPGHQAAAKYNVLAPLLQAGLYKSEIRALAEEAGLPSYDRPQAACLSSRFPKHIYIDPERLSIVDRAEEAVRSFGFRQVRVRFRQVPLESNNQTPLESNNQTSPGNQNLARPASADLNIEAQVIASVEIGEDELEQLRGSPDVEALICNALLGLGFGAVHIDPRGYRQGGADNG